MHQTRITPCRDRISDRFPVASFVVQVPRNRLFEVACATDPRLFHPDRVHQRTPQNFSSTRYGGLLRAPAGEATYLVPPQQLKQFAGATRLYYALGTYGNVNGDDPYFTTAPDDPAQMPCIQISPDFTGRTLDRSRFGRREPTDARYGAPSTPLTWGGDALARKPGTTRNDPRRFGSPQELEYDDGYDKALWARASSNGAPANGGAPACTPPPPPPPATGTTGGELYSTQDNSAPAPPEAADEYDEFEDGYSQQGGDQERIAVAPPPATSSTALAPVPGLDLVNDAFKARVREIASRLGTDPDHLTATISVHTGGTFSPSVQGSPGTGATGLIQFLPATAARLGTSVEALAAMTPEGQLEFVERYLTPFKGQLSSVEDVFVATLWPAAVGKPPDEVLFAAGTPTYDQYQALDINQDGAVTKGEAAARVVEVLRAARTPATAAVAQRARYAPARYGAAVAGFEDAPDLARRGGRSSPVRYGSSARQPRPLGRPQSSAVPPFVRAAGDASPAATQPAPAVDGIEHGALPGRFADYSDVWVAEHELPVEAMRARILSAPQTLTASDRLRLIDLVARFEGGAAGHAAINADGEFDTPSLAQFQRVHVGLSWGYVQAAQRYGALGEVLAACERRDRNEFLRTFGDAADELLRVTNAPTEEERLAPVAGALLWEQPWLGRFERAATMPQFQAAQREMADTYFFAPNLPIAGWLGFTTDRALTMMFDRAVHMGRAGGLRWIVSTVSPIRSQTQRAAALAALGFQDLPSFAQSVGSALEGLAGPAGAASWSTPVHAALLGALRSLGSASPVAIPSLNEMLDALVKTARDNAKGGDRFWTIASGRLAALRTTTELTDAHYLM